MTKRELITALEALPCEDTMEVCITECADGFSWPEPIIDVDLAKGSHYDKMWADITGPFICLMSNGERDDAQV